MTSVINLLSSRALAWMGVVLGLVVINALAHQTIRHNSEMGVYPLDSDAAAFSQVHFWFLSALGALGLALLSGAGVVARWLGGPREPLFARAGSITLLAAGYVGATCYFAVWGCAWWEPDHHGISAAVLTLTCLVAWLGWLETRSVLQGRANDVPLPKWFD